MNYAEKYEEHKAYWDAETQRRKIDRALDGQKAPLEADVIRLLKPDKPALLIQIQKKSKKKKHRKRKKRRGKFG